MGTRGMVGVLLWCVAAGCSRSPHLAPLGTGGNATSGSTEAETAQTGGEGGGVQLETGDAGDTGDTGGCVVVDPDVDMDGDGWTPAQGDCNDCDPNVNPGAVDTITVADGGVVLGDEDCDGIPGEVPEPCDDGLLVDDPSPLHAARAVELCHPLTDPRKWGLVSAKWVLPDGSDPSALVPSPGTSAATALANFALGHGILPAFGPDVHVQAGSRMLALSSGSARQPSDPGYHDVSGFDKGYSCPSPMGFPKESPACPGILTGKGHDGVALEVSLVAPTNAHGFSFGFNFFTYEWPTWVCTTYDDFFVALLQPVPGGQTDGNISFDGMGNPLSVNSAFLDVCGCPAGPPCHAGNKIFTCALGDAGLVGTGFGKSTSGVDHGSTSWLSTRAPVAPHEAIVVRWTVYDSGDGMLDTTVLIDDWQWILTSGVAVETRTVSQPK